MDVHMPHDVDHAYEDVNGDDVRASQYQVEEHPSSVSQERVTNSIAVEVQERLAIRVHLEVVAIYTLVHQPRLADLEEVGELVGTSGGEGVVHTRSALARHSLAE